MVRSLCYIWNLIRELEPLILDRQLLNHFTLPPHPSAPRPSSAFLVADAGAALAFGITSLKVYVLRFR